MKFFMNKIRRLHFCMTQIYTNIRNLIIGLFELYIGSLVCVKFSNNKSSIEDFDENFVAQLCSDIVK